MRKVFFILFISLVTSNTIHCQKNKDQHCYAKCIIQDSFSFEVKELPVFLDDSRGDYKYLEYVIVDLDGLTDSVLIVTDTLNYKNFHLDYYKVKRLIQRGGHTENRKVICDSKKTNTFYSTLQTALSEKGFSVGFDNARRTKLKIALVNFQKAYGLPIGQLDFETLRALGLDDFLR